MAEIKHIIAKRIAQELKDGTVVNLGIGLPTLVGDYIPDGVSVLFQSENGLLGMGPAANDEEKNPDLTNAGGGYVTAVTGASFFDSATSFTMIRGGHVDLTVLGALQVDEKGNLASHTIPGKMTSGMGGAMDLVVGSRYIIVGMTHTAKDGGHKIVRELSLPITAMGKVDLIVTEYSVIEVTKEGLILREIKNGMTPEELQKITGATLLIPPDVKSMPE